MSHGFGPRIHFFLIAFSLGSCYNLPFLSTPSAQEMGGRDPDVPAHVAQQRQVMLLDEPVLTQVPGRLAGVAGPPSRTLLVGLLARGGSGGRMS